MRDGRTRSGSRPVRRAAVSVLALVVGAGLTACSAPGPGPAAGAATPSSAGVTSPSSGGAATASATGASAAVGGVPSGTVDYQLGGGYPPAPGVVGVVRDSTDEPEPGTWSLCYVNAFQTQPDETGQWLAERPDLVLRHADGSPVTDEAWPDEVLLDLSTDAARRGVAEVVGRTVDLCAAKGFDGVELDNLDSWTRSDGALTADDALALAALLVDRARAAGLVVAQKNAAELGARGRDEAGFDLAVVESCHRWDECADYAAVYGDQVVAIEYTDELRGTFAEVCADPDTPASTVLRDRDLLPAGAAGHVLDLCEEAP